MTRIVLTLLISAVCHAAYAQGGPPRDLPKMIEDNSFLIEEAYNQERGVIQHISAATYSPSTRDFTYTFTEEWPLFVPAHQISVTAPFSSLPSEHARGPGDLLINYRYQLFTKEDGTAVAPRFSVILPSGDSARGLGLGGRGFQINVPASRRLSDHWITHWNAGFTAQSAKVTNTGVQQTLTAYNVGASLIWLTAPTYNFMLEYTTNFGSELDDSGRKTRFTDLVVGPGFRYAINRGALQIVPGIGLPVSIRDGEPRWGVLFYLSFEHPIASDKSKSKP